MIVWRLRWKVTRAALCYINKFQMTFWLKKLPMLCAGEWESSCNELQRMLLVRSLRQDRVAFCVTSFIVNNLGSKFVEPPVLDLRQVVDDSTAKTPLIFVLSPGVVSVVSSLYVVSADFLLTVNYHQ